MFIADWAIWVYNGCYRLHLNLMNINWKLFFVLLGGSIFGMLTVIPFVLTVQGNILKEIPLSLPFLLTFQVVQNFFVLGFFIFIGLLLSKRIGLGVPYLEQWLAGKKTKRAIGAILMISLAGGLLAGVLILTADAFFSLFIGPVPSGAGFEPGQNGLLGSTGETAIARVSVPVWQGFLASFYGGITEEIMMRFFVMTLLVFIFYKIKSTKEGKPTVFGIWLAIVLAAVLFGIGRLPFTATLTILTPIIITRAIILNGIGGIIFGWLYWKRGLESAILAHFSADIFLLVFLPIFFS